MAVGVKDGYGGLESSLTDDLDALDHSFGYFRDLSQDGEEDATVGSASKDAVTPTLVLDPAAAMSKVDLAQRKAMLIAACERFRSHQK